MPWSEIKLTMLECEPGYLCRRRYPGHPRGCPNYAKKPSCPPTASMIGQVMNLGRTVYAVWNAFALGEHVRKMRQLHPNWTDRQARCCLYWQQGARKELSAEIKAFTKDRRGLVGVTCPEARGVDVTKTMESIGVKLEWPPIEIAYQVAIVGYQLRRS